MGQVVRYGSSLLSSDLVYNPAKQIKGIEVARLKTSVNHQIESGHQHIFLANVRWMGELYLLT